MQTYLPLIQAMLSEWYLFTLSNMSYAAALATAVWLLTTLLYSIKTAALNRAQLAHEKLGAENLNALQVELQQGRQELTESVLHIEKAASTAQHESQRALTLEQLIFQRNQQIAGLLQTLATGFDLGVRPLLADSDVKADLLWQQHDKVMTQLIERLKTEQQTKLELQQTCQAKTAKLAEKEALLEALQTTLAGHADQLSKLELAFEQQKAVLQQQDHAQQLLADTLENYRIDAPRPAQLDQETSQPVTPSVASPILGTQAAPNAPDMNNEPYAAVSWREPATAVESVSTVEAAAPVPTDIKPQAAMKVSPYLSLDIEQQPVKPAQGSLGKIKNLFGKKPQPVKTEPQWVAANSEEALPIEEQQSDDEVSGKLHGFYRKFKSKAK